MSIAYTEVLPQTEHPLFSLTVITVCRNDLSGLKSTVDSVLRQKALGSLRIEHVVIDGNSDDGTKEWLAEMHEQGKVEVYISEPDCGIYDAMNKGINRAHGAVLAFLNAGDTYTSEDIACCVNPILQGECVHCAASALLQDMQTGRILSQSLYHSAAALIVTPCCHQAYFAQAELYRREGGYAAEHYRCSADGVFINRIIAQVGDPLVIPHNVVHFATGGFSSECGIWFVDEFIRMQWRYHPQAMQRAHRDEACARFLASNLLHHYRNLPLWLEKHQGEATELLQHLLSMCRDAVSLPLPPSVSLLLRYLAEHRIPGIIKGEAFRPRSPWFLHLKGSYCLEVLRKPQYPRLLPMLITFYRELRFRLSSLLKPILKAKSGH